MSKEDGSSPLDDALRLFAEYRAALRFQINILSRDASGGAEAVKAADEALKHVHKALQTVLALEARYGETHDRSDLRGLDLDAAREEVHRRVARLKTD